MSNNWNTIYGSTGSFKQQNVAWDIATPKPKMSKSYIIKAKSKIFRLLDLDKTTNINIRTLCNLFLTEYQNFKWKNDISETVNVVSDLLKTEEEENLIIVIEILKSLERK